MEPTSEPDPLRAAEDRLRAEADALESADKPGEARASRLAAMSLRAASEKFNRGPTN